MNLSPPPAKNFFLKIQHKGGGESLAILKRGGTQSFGVVLTLVLVRTCDFPILYDPLPGINDQSLRPIDT